MLRALNFSILLLAGIGVSQASIIHNYTFETDGQVIDLAGTENGTLVSTASVTGGKLVLNGGYVEFDTHLVPTSASYSVSVDFQLASTGNPGIVEFISQGASGGPGFYLGTNGSGFRASDSWPSPAGSYDPADPHTLLLSVDSVAGQSYLYLDGALLGTRNFAITTTTGGTDTRLGAQFSWYGEYFHGTLDNIRIFDTAITPDQNVNVAETPEPSTILTGALGVGAAVFARRRRKSRS
jgi:MYXO-CTERM domain-containing protein